MLIETIEAETRPMLYVTRTASMDPQEIAVTMKDAFDAMGAFLGQSAVRPAGPPLAVYRDWDKASGRMKIDVGFPVAPADSARATGEVHAGQTPAGAALKAIHRGPYATLRETYAAVQAHMDRLGISRSPLAWEVYLSDPETTPAEELLTEVYMSLP